MNDTIEFTPEAVKQYLVAAVQKWRCLRDDPEYGDWPMASHYIDAFQSMRTTLFGTLVPEKNP